MYCKYLLTVSGLLSDSCNVLSVRFLILWRPTYSSCPLVSYLTHLCLGRSWVHFLTLSPRIFIFLSFWFSSVTSNFLMHSGGGFFPTCISNWPSHLWKTPMLPPWTATARAKYRRVCLCPWSCSGAVWILCQHLPCSLQQHHVVLVPGSVSLPPLFFRVTLASHVSTIPHKFQSQCVRFSLKNLLTLTEVILNLSWIWGIIPFKNIIYVFFKFSKQFTHLSLTLFLGM